MNLIKAKVIEIIPRTSTVSSFRFEPETKIDFTAGQFIQIIFDDKVLDNKELNKFLSFSCSPDKNYIEVTKRLSDSLFSRELKSLKIADQVLLKGPWGKCVFDSSYKKIGFLIGGIGITPVISIIEYINDKKIASDVVLFYSNRIEEEIAFKRELDLWQKQNNNIKIFYTVSEQSPQDKNCVFGRIDRDLIGQDPYLMERILFIFGPPKMVEAMKSLCLEVGCKPENIKTENFIGY